jgi:hypothetical protein
MMKRFTLKRNKKSKYNSKKSKSLNVNRAKKGGNINIGKTRELYFGARQIDEDHTHRFVIQKESKKGNIETDYQDCECPIEDYGANCANNSDDCNEINLNCECSTKKSSKKKIVQEAWNPNYNDPEDSDSDSDDENVEFTETSGDSYSPEESEDSLREELDDLKKKLEETQDYYEICRNEGNATAKDCEGILKEINKLKMRRNDVESRIGGGSKNTKKSKLSKLKSLIKDYERVIKKYRNKIIKFNSTTKDKSSKKSTKDSNDKSSNKSKKLSVKKSKSKSKSKSKAKST